MNGLSPLAHGLVGRADLPIPEWLFGWAAALVLVASFVALAALWPTPRLQDEHWRPLPDGLSRVLTSRPVELACGAVGAALLVLVVVSGLAGTQSTTANFAPTFVYVGFWLALVPLSVLFGDLFRAFNPWRAIGRATGFVARAAARGGLPAPLPYPERLGRWPAAVLLFSFTAYELAYLDASEPRSLALAILLYSWINWVGAAVFGRETWFEHCEAFTLYFGFLSRIAPFGVSEREGPRELVVRPPFRALARWDLEPGTLAVVAVMLGSVAFDGFSRTSMWQNRLFDIEADLISSPGLSDFVVTLVNVLGLTVFVGLVAGFYLLAVAGARAVAHAHRPLVGAFVFSLVPIALAYALAHYFSLLVNQGQFAIPLASDPFGWGWDVLGTADFSPNLTALTPNMIWYTQVGVLIAGHVLGLVLAHDRAIALFSSARIAVRTQYAFLLLMVLYTVGGLWLLSQG